MKKLLQLLAFIVVLPLATQAQRTCPTLYSRNNGNNAPSDCPGAGGAFDQAAGFAGSPYAYTSCCSSLTKTGAFFMKWTSSVAPTYVPAIKNVYIDGAVATTIMGPASSFDSITTTGKKAIKYCFYTVNLPNASKFAIEFVNPLNDTLYSTCSYTWSGSGDIDPTTPPTVTGNPTGGTRCVGSGITFTISATPTTTVNTACS